MQRQPAEKATPRPAISPQVSLDARFTHAQLVRLSQLERWHFWFVGRRVLIDRLLDKYLNGKAQFVLDLGCGTGLMVDILMQQGHRVVGLDIRPEGLRATRQAQPESWLLQAEATHLPLAENVFDAVMLLDVLEHVDDRALLAGVHRILRPGGLVLITVPAMPWLWSGRDEAAHHLRRYTRRHLSRVLGNAQFSIEEVRYYQCLLMPIVAITRFLGRRRPGPRGFEERPPSLVNTILTWVNTLEVKLSDRIPWPWGSSLVAIGRKQ